jgi:hypothetical protein
MAGGESRLEVVAPRVGVEVQHLAAEEKPVYDAGGHRPGIDLLERDPARRDDRRGEGKRPFDVEPQRLEEGRKPLALTGIDLMTRSLRRYPGHRDKGFDHLVGKQPGEEAAAGVQDFKD